MGKLHPFTRNDQLEQLSLGRRLHLEQLGLGRRLPFILVGIIGISRVFQMFTIVLQPFSYLHELSFKTFSSLSLHVKQILTYKLRHINTYDLTSFKADTRFQNYLYPQVIIDRYRCKEKGRWSLFKTYLSF